MHRLYILAFFLLNFQSITHVTAADALFTDAAISPSGNKIAFSSGGNIYLVNSTGGTGQPLTVGDEFDEMVHWSPNERQLAFSRTANSGKNIYLLNLDDQSLQQLTFESGSKQPMSFSPDGQNFLYANRQLGDEQNSIRTPLHQQDQNWSINLKSGRKSLYQPNGGVQGDFNSDQSKLLYVAINTVEPTTRRHRGRSDASEIWFYDIKSRHHSRPFAKDGVHRTNPVFASNGQSFFYLAETGETINIWRWDPGNKITQITFFEDNDLSNLSVSRDDNIAFVKGYKIYHLSPDEQQPKQLDITLQTAIDNSPVYQEKKTAHQLVPSPDGQLFASIVNADLYLYNKYGKHKRLTQTVGAESDPSFSPDGKHLIYAASRDNIWGLYRIDIERPDKGDSFILPETSDEQVVFADRLNRRHPTYSPDGKSIAYYVEGREVAIIDAQSGKETKLFRPQDYSFFYDESDYWFSFSPNSRYLALPFGYSGSDAVMRVGIVPVDASTPIQSISDKQALIAQVEWSRDGSQLIAVKGNAFYQSTNAAGRGLISIFLSDEARSDALEAGEKWAQTTCSLKKGVADSCPPDDVTAKADKGGDSETQQTALGIPPKLKPYSFTTTEDRFKLETNLLSTQDNIIFGTSLRDNIRLLIVSDHDSYYHIDTINRLTGERVRLKSLELDDKVNSIHYLDALDQLDFVTNKDIWHISLRDENLSQEAETTTLPEIKLDYIPSQRRMAAFEEAWSKVQQQFYRSDLHGVDWNAIGNRYRMLVAATRHDGVLAQLIRDMFGELGASHLFVNYNPMSKEKWLTYDSVLPAQLGFFRSGNDDGPGEQIAAVLPGGPLDRPYYNIAKGDRIISINDVSVPDAGGVDRLLAGKEGEAVTLKLQRNNTTPPQTYTLTTRPVNSETIDALNQRRWIDHLRSRVREITDGCVIYHYLPEMNGGTYSQMANHLLAQQANASAALIDIRGNRGGNQTTEIIRFLDGTAQAIIGREDLPQTVIPFDQWLRPSSLLTDSFAYSDGSVFTQTFKDVFAGQSTKHRIYGEPVQGTGTAVIYDSLKTLPEITIGIPVLPLRRLDGSYFENHMTEPDVEILYDPNLADSGIDNMLKTAASSIYQQLKLTKSCPPAATIH